MPGRTAGRAGHRSLSGDRWHRLRLGRVTSRLTLGALWLVKECWRESVYSLGQAHLVAGAFRVLTLSVLLGPTLGPGDGQRAHPEQLWPHPDASSLPLQSGLFGLGSRDALAGVDEQLK